MKIFFGIEQDGGTIVDIHADSWAQAEAFAGSHCREDSIEQDNNCPMCGEWLDEAICDESDTEAFEIYDCKICGCQTKYVNSTTFAAFKMIIIDLGKLKIEEST